MSDCSMYAEILSDLVSAINLLGDESGSPTAEQEEQLTHLMHGGEYEDYNRDCGIIEIYMDPIDGLYKLRITEDETLPGWGGAPPDVDLSYYTDEETGVVVGVKDPRSATGGIRGPDRDVWEAYKEQGEKRRAEEAAAAAYEAPVDEFCKDIVPPPIDATININSGQTACDSTIVLDGKIYENFHKLQDISQKLEPDGTLGDHSGGSLSEDGKTRTQRIRMYKSGPEPDVTAYNQLVDYASSLGYDFTPEQAWYKYVIERIPTGSLPHVGPRVINDSFAADSSGLKSDDFGLLMGERSVEFLNVYNYYAGEFEEYFKLSDVSEKLIPSLYAIVLNNLAERPFDDGHGFGPEYSPPDDTFFRMDPFVITSTPGGVHGTSHGYGEEHSSIFGINSFSEGSVEEEYSVISQKNITLRQRFEEYARDIRSFPDGLRSEVENKNSNLIFTPGSFDDFRNIAEGLVSSSNRDTAAQFQYYMQLFPMYNAIRFSTDSYTSGESNWFAESKLVLTLIAYIKQVVYLYENSLGVFSDSEFIEAITSAVASEGSTTTYTHEHGLELKEISINQGYESESSQVVKSFSMESVIERLGDLFTLLDVDDSLSGDITDLTRNLIVDNSNQIFMGILDPGDEEYHLFDQVKDGDVYNIYVNKTRINDLIGLMSEKDPPDFLNTCSRVNESETILYRIAKFKGAAQTEGFVGAPYGSPIQNFWFPNPGEEDNITFIDTQIKYGETYTYVLYAYELVFGTETEFIYGHTPGEMGSSLDGNMKSAYEAFGITPPASLNTSGIDINYPLYNHPGGTVLDANATFTTKVRHHYRINEVEVFKKTTTMVDKPPLPPEVRINSVSKTESKLLFSLNTAFGEQDLKPVYIEQSAESALIAEVVSAYGSGPGDTVPFKSDDLTAKFEIYRLDAAPTSYSDFQNNLRSTVLIGNSTSGFYVDSLKPNKKYYYTFRSVDLHENVSNPSPVYEIQMVKDSSGDTVVTFPEIQQYHMDSKTPNLTKDFKKLFNLVPQPEQAAVVLGSGPAVNYEALPEYQLFGDESEKSLFKIRVTSKKTGKKVDLNISFVKEVIS